jgi:hypothetical protein
VRERENERDRERAHCRQREMDGEKGHRKIKKQKKRGARREDRHT